MRIKDVEQRTGLTRKSIRFYEAKGLLNVKRTENTYREYDEELILRLQTIALFRQAGVSVSDIQLWQDQVLTLEEMLLKRLEELKGHQDLAAGQISLCRNILSDGIGRVLASTQDPESLLDEEEPEELPGDAQLCLGIDIGTTTLSAVVLNLGDNTLAAAYTIPGNANLPVDHPWEKCQEVSKIENRITRLVNALLNRYGNIQAIGFTGQMHGILYLDAENRPCSPLYTWQDGRAGQGSPSTCDQLTRETGMPIAPGYGLATHCHLMRSNSLPSGAQRLCTIMDYLAWKLSGFQNMLMHSTNAASLGFFRPESGCFDRAVLEKAGIDPSFLPAITSENTVIGTYQGIPVTVAIGDNQASFLGSVAQPDRMGLVNFGTGSQISLMTGEDSEITAQGDIEVRPFLGSSRLVSGSALCGGRAYALLERFFRSFIGGDAEQYELLNRFALEGLQEPNLPKIRTTFCGTRRFPELRGQITDLSEDNFTPASFAAGTLLGMAEELQDMYTRMPHGNIRELVASGNAIRKNPALKLALEQVFGMKIRIPLHREEAAFGAAMFAALSGGLGNLAQLQQSCIHYR